MQRTTTLPTAISSCKVIFSLSVLSGRNVVICCLFQKGKYFHLKVIVVNGDLGHMGNVEWVGRGEGGV